MPTIEERLRTTGEVWRAHVDTGDVRAPAHPRSSRATPRRRIALVAAAAGIAAAGAVAGIVIHNVSGQAGNHGGVSASCAAPQVLLPGSQANTRPIVHPGEEVTVAGRYFLDGCNDTDPSLHPAPRPVAAHLVLRHGTHTARLGTIRTHGELGSFRTTVLIPGDFPTGPATLVSEDPPSSPLKLTIRAPERAAGTASSAAPSPK